MPFRRSRLPAALGLVLCLLTACTPNQVLPRPGPSPVSDAHALDRFYDQKLAWGSCAPYATEEQSQEAFRTPGVECARLMVPLDYAQPQGPTITVGVLRHKASDPADRIGSLVMNPGGPGGSGMEAAARLVPTVANQAIGLRFDLVGFDPRGVGASEPRVRCLSDAERDAERASHLGDGTTPGSDAAWRAEGQDFAAKCVQRTQYGARMLANVGTRDVVKDLDILRATLGDKKLTYLGYSYGTQIGFQYAEAFPANVRALLLDGAIDPAEDEMRSLVAQGAGFASAFGLFAAACAKHTGCAVGGDPSHAVARFEELTRPLLTAPATAAGGRRLSYDDAMTGVVEAMYSQRSWPILNAALNLLATGDGSLLLQLADSYYERGPDGRYSSLQAAYYAVRCVDNPRQPPAAIAATYQQMLAAAPFLGGGRPDEGEPGICGSWPVPSTAQPHDPIRPGVPSPLVISTVDDPVTPYQDGVNLARQMHGGLLTYEGAQHTAFLHGDQCVDVNGLAYLVDGTLPPPGTRCPSR
ncbi:alpha/beta hydrolase [Amycolatopsis alkalitolerans]|uniref:Alpha/beta hydrolase n=1 Tax=Amycolatopsis alkalitolerans TaxID=2547244 RepID=A0A5C4LVJ9_9PSEU|nr:alpha/beta hydrolase [Amycolatopsis alkalitolerans]TNC23126.1 alpha/beta hydrolase [Amycolatopsis alkalitolerans]